jgi:hypothetical protein
MQASVATTSFVGVARSAGANDTGKFAACMRDPASSAIVDSGVAAGRRLGIDGTPTLLVNGWKYDGFVPEVALRRIIANLIRGKRPPNSNGVRTSAAPIVTVADGVPTLHYDREVFDSVPQYVLSSAPLAVAGGPDTDPDFDLTALDRAVLFADGRLVASAAPGRILSFDRSGRPERVVGRRGRGPGEYLRASIVHGGTDTLLIFDGANRRLTWFDSRGALLATKTIDISPSLLANTLLGALGAYRIVLTSAGLIVSTG